MKLSHKLIMVSAAALMGVSPLLGAAQSVNPVAQAASKSSSKKGTITLSNNAYVYHKNGKRDTNYAGGGKNAVIAKNITLKYVGKPITINGNEYYPIGGNDYVKAANVGYKDGKAVTPSTSKIPTTDKTTVKTQTLTTNKSTKKAVSKKTTITLNHNAYIYNSKGKTDKKLVKKGQTFTVDQLTDIGGKLFYRIKGQKNQFIKNANVGTVNGPKITPATKLTTVTLTHNAYIYNGFGGTKKKVIKKGKTIIVDRLMYIDTTLYYKVGGQKNQFIKMANTTKETGPDLKPSNHKPVPDTMTVITLNHNAYVYDGNGKSDKVLLKKGQRITVDQLKYIGSKLYYRIADKNYPGDDQWVKKANVGIIEGKQLKPDNSMPINNTPSATITVGNDTYVHNSRGEKQTTMPFTAGHTARVSEMKYIWIPDENKADLFYKLASDKDGYVKASDVSGITGDSLSPVNTEQEAKDDTVIATKSDKQDLQAELDKENDIKSSDAYKFASESLRDTYDSDADAADEVNSSSVSSVAEVKNATQNLEDAAKALDGASPTSNN
ncbi:SLAP domain-containing protein [Lactobacillus acetotolerans]|uniref:SLAP domain-containing protein n=1 Tax=Lactobacillus acetotolerans TaxID=1600 RepID=UPI0019D2F351|nr:SLAP domain-containing protein [Lactobacillus acetotolerans]MBN7277180.1 hypothetical protein [Lactobacillus acetotolerans]